MAAFQPSSGWPSYTDATLHTPAHPQPSGGAATLRIAYLLSRYPAVSHTFFLKEVLGLRQRGLDIRVASINVPDRARQDLPEVEGIEADQTYYVKSGGMAGLGLQVLMVAVRHPMATLRGLRAASRLGGLNLKAWAYAFLYLAEALLVGRWMRRQSLHHLHVHFGGPVATVGMITAQAWQVPWSVTLHGPDEFFDQEAFYLRQKAESAAFVVCISDFCRSQVMRLAPNLSHDRLEVVRLGVDCAALRPRESIRVADRSAATASPTRLVCTGRMVSAKGHRILLEALSPLVSEGIPISCVLIGDGPERSSLEALTERLGISQQVRFLGALAHDATLAEVACADIFVLASFAEGLPVALMEAMAVGVPCVSTTIAAIPELIESGENGFLVSPSNVPALTEALRRLAKDSDLRRNLGEKARVTVEKQYNLARNLDQLAATWVRRLGADPTVHI